MSKVVIIIAVIFWCWASFQVGSDVAEERGVKGFTCTQQRAVSDTMPQEFECTQWTKGGE